MPTVGAAEARVPKPAAIGGDGALRHPRGAPRGRIGKPQRHCRCGRARGLDAVLFAEGPTAHWALPLPEPVAGAPAGLQRFAFALDGLPPGESGKGATLRLTAVAGDKAIEVAFRLD